MSTKWFKSVTTSKFLGLIKTTSLQEVSLEYVENLDIRSVTFIGSVGDDLTYVGFDNSGEFVQVVRKEV